MKVQRRYKKQGIGEQGVIEKLRKRNKNMKKTNFKRTKKKETMKKSNWKGFFFELPSEQNGRFKEKETKNRDEKEEEK